MEKPQSNSINIGDVVEVNYPSQSNWNGIQFRVKENSSHYYNGTVVKTTTPEQAKVYPIGSVFTWSCSEGLVVISLDPDNPTENQVYIDHIYERLTQNATPEELLILAARLEAFAK